MLGFVPYMSFLCVQKYSTNIGSLGKYEQKRVWKIVFMFDLLLKKKQQLS